MSLETITGNLKTCLSQALPETISLARELTKERISNKPLRDTGFWTRDFPMYYVKNGEAVLDLDEANNLVFENIDDAVKQLLETHNYVPSKKDAARVKKSVASGNGVHVVLSKLDLKKYNNEWGYFEINTTNPDSLNPEQSKLAERIYGLGADFNESMLVLKNSGINTTRVYVLNPEYVKQKAGKGAVGRASWLDSFGGYSNFDAGGRNVGDISRGRGVRRGAEGARAENGNAYETAYNRLVAEPDKVTPEIAIGLSKLLTSYLTRTTKQ